MPRNPFSVNIWNYFERTSDIDKIAECNYCRRNLSYKTTITNLKQHLKLKHLSIYNEYLLLSRPGKRAKDEPASATAAASEEPTEIESSLPQDEGENEKKQAWKTLRNKRRYAYIRQKNFKPKCRSVPVNLKTWRCQDNTAYFIPYREKRLGNMKVREEIHDNGPSQAHSDNEEIDIQENLLDYQELQTNNKDTKKNLAGITANDFTISNVKNDPLFHFFISMYETTKRLPPLSQHTIKTDIFSLVAQEESKHLIQYSPRPQSSTAHISDAES